MPLTSAVFDWETAAASGTIGSADLLNMTAQLFDGASLVYTDVMVLDGVVQPIGGVARSLSDLRWTFNLDSLSLSVFDNDVLVVQNGSTGTTYNIIALGTTFGANRFVNGSFSGGAQYSMAQVTVPADVPSHPPPCCCSAACRC